MKVLVAVDLSGTTETLIDMIKRQQWPHGTNFHVVTIVESTTGRFAYHPFEGSKEELDQEMAVAADRLGAIVQSLRQHCPHATVSGGVIVGGAVESIVSQAAEMHADLIIVGHQGTYGQGGYSLGGVAERIVHHAPCSVIVVKPKISVDRIEAEKPQGATK